ncbi:MAG: dNTP triphosphohydrolase [Bacteroidia bacterium]|nr:dNTP triphosphohydrolase [Bacteroidia bacterium]
MPLDWDTLFPLNRYGQSEFLPSQEYARSEFERDFDRIIFSSFFRRLQNKTQVYPLPGSVLVHNRLTHSLEVSSVGRSLGRMCGSFILQKSPTLQKVLTQGDIGAIVAAAALAHDVGNPPFGHAGEDAISDFFKNGYGYNLTEDLPEKYKSDFENFEGNAHGFHLLTNTNSKNNLGGLHLTASTLLAFSKYPHHSTHSGFPKWGYFQAEAENMLKLANHAQLVEYEYGCYLRHPLAFLVEAADDICYQIMDFEDAFRLQLVTFQEAETLLQTIAAEEIRTYNYHHIQDANECIAYLRGRCINKLVHQVSQVFEEKMDTLLCPDDQPVFEPLIKSIPSAQSQVLKEIKIITRTRLYEHPHVLSMELDGNRQLQELLKVLIEALIENPNTTRSAKIKKFIPKQFIYEHLVRDPVSRYGVPGSGSSGDNGLYNQLMGIVCFVAGMTDLYVLDFSRKLGIAI